MINSRSYGSLPDDVPRTYRRYVSAIAVVLVFMATACTGYREPKPPVARYSQQIANVYVSAYPEVPWSDISALLTPNLNLTIQQAQAIADSTTAAQSLLVSTILSRGLAVNLPTTSTPTPTAGQVPTTIQVAGAVPTLPAPQQVGTPPTIAPSAPLTPVDGTELLVTSTALFQQAAIVDNQISKQYLPYGYTGHLITLQINVQPLRDDWSYDAFVDITLIPSPWSAAVANSLTAHEGAGVVGPVVVKPLIITDALETSSVQQSIQQIQQALLQISGSIGKVGAAAGYGSGSNIERGISAYDKNSLVTAGRVNDATIRVRLGAAYSGLGRPALIPRTYNISLFVLTRSFNTKVEKRVITQLDQPLVERLMREQEKAIEALQAPKKLEAETEEFNSPEETTGSSPITELAVITHTIFLPSNVTDLGKDPTLEYVPEARLLERSELAKSVAKTIKSFGYPAATFGCTYRNPTLAVDKKPNNDKEDWKEANLDVLRAVQRGDYQSMRTCLQLNPKLEVTEEVKLNFFINAMSELDETSHFTSLAIPLKDVTPQLPDKRQLAVVTENADQSQQTVTLVGGRYLTADQLRAMAIVEFSGGKREWLLPASMSFSNSIPSQLTLTFTNPEGLGPVPTPGANDQTGTPSRGAKLLGVQLELTHLGSDGIGDEAWYPHIAKVTAIAQPKTSGNQVQSSAPKNPVSQTAQLCAATQKPITVTTTTTDTSWDGANGPSAKVAVTVGETSKLLQACAATFGPTSTPTLASPFTVAVSGADAMPDGTCLLSSKGKIALSQSGQCQGSLILTNFAEAIPVTLTITDTNGTNIGQPITLRVLDTKLKR
jgi:hypothetical protein